MKGTCKYCKCVLPDVTNIRCDNCDTVWQAGFNAGRKDFSERLHAVLYSLLNLGNMLEQEKK